MVSKDSRVGDFSGGPVVKNLQCNAGDLGSILSQETKIPHAAELLRPRATTRVCETKDPTWHNKDPEHLPWQSCIHDAVK